MMIRGATLSECERYRYRLWRSWTAPGTSAAAQRLIFIGLNPSTADATVDDATVRKWTGFAKRWGYGGFTAVTLFAWRATEPSALADAADPCGRLNELELMRGFAKPALLVPCWGALTKLPPRLRGQAAVVSAMLRRYRYRVRCLGYTTGGDPRHPLMLPYATTLVPWPQPKENHP